MSSPSPFDEYNEGDRDFRIDRVVVVVRVVDATCCRYPRQVHTRVANDPLHRVEDRRPSSSSSLPLPDHPPSSPPAAR